MTEEYKKETFLRQKYWEENMSLRDIAKNFEVTAGTLKYYMDKNDIPTRKANSEKAGHYRIDSSGYPRFKVHEDGKIKRIRIHRLLAIAKYGVEEVKDKEVHHKNGIKWDNRYENIELLGKAEHASLHADK